MEESPRSSPEISTPLQFDLVRFYYLRLLYHLLQAPKASILALVATLIPQFISISVGIDLGLIDSKANPGKSIVSIPLNGTLYKYIAIKGFTDYTVYHVWLLFFAQCTRYIT